MPVPTVKEEFEYDDPILGSTAEPVDSEYGQSLYDVNIVTRKYGQQLFGNMIPIREKDMMLQRQSEQQGLADAAKSLGVITEADGEAEADADESV
mmetsp:Transcript_14460/g.34992  ORF Transcript_14460/g.34992 Transcript_14460/m.34992 type:complete len:95 (+) Transcript_14460:2309-2593(+)